MIRNGTQFSPFSADVLDSAQEPAHQQLRCELTRRGRPPRGQWPASPASNAAPRRAARPPTSSSGRSCSKRNGTVVAGAPAPHLRPRGRVHSRIRALSAPRLATTIDLIIQPNDDALPASRRPAYADDPTSWPPASPREAAVIGAAGHPARSRYVHHRDASSLWRHGLLPQLLHHPRHKLPQSPSLTSRRSSPSLPVTHLPCTSPCTHTPTRAAS